MIKYDYKIIRNEEDEEKTYTPILEKELPALTYIEGPNSSGKSTLLNLMGVAFGGNRRKNINPSLKSKMISLVDSDHQKVGFEIEIEEHGEILKISKDIESKVILSRLNGKIISKEKIEEKYNLIYDIPEDPTDRLNQLVGSIRINQEQMSSRLSSLRAYLQEQLNAVKRSKDPEKVHALQEKLTKLDNEIINIRSEILSAEKDLKIIQSYFYMHWYRDNHGKMLDISRKIKECEKSNKQAKKNIDVKLQKKRILVEKYIIDCKKVIVEINKDIDKVFKSTNDIRKAWNELDYSEIINVEIVPNRYLKILDKLIVELKSIEKSIPLSKKKNYEMWQQVIQILETSDDEQLEIPGVAKKLNEFIYSLKSENRGLKKDIDRITIAEVLRDYVEDLRKNTRVLSNDILPEYVQVKNETPNSFQENKYYNYENLIEQETQYKMNMKKYRDLCISLGIDIDNDDVLKMIKDQFQIFDANRKLRVYKEKQSLEFIEDESQKLDKLIKKLNGMNQMREYHDKEHQDMINAPEHKYSGRAQEIEQLITISMKLKQNMDAHNKELDDLSDGKRYREKSNEKYFGFVFEYLGKKIGTLRHIDGQYEIRQVDLFKEEMLTSSGKKIKFTDMGTGQSQSAYLIGKLNTLDNRKAIVLIDEVAMMDKQSLKPIFEKLRSLYAEKRLLAAIVVQKANVLTVKDL